MAIDLESYLQKYAPPPDDSQDWRAQLMTLGLGLMGARKGEELQRFGQSGLLAMGVGQDLKKTRREEHRQRMQDVAAAWKLAKDQEAMDQKSELIRGVMDRYARDQGGGAPQPGPGMMPPGVGPGLPPGMPPGMPAGGPQPGPGMSAPPMGAAPQGGPISPAAAPFLPRPTGTPAQPGPFPGARGPQVNPLALVAALTGEGDVGKLIQDTENKAAEFGAIKVQGNTIFTQGGGPIGSILPDGRGYEINGQFVPASPAFLAALKAQSEDALERAIRQDEAKARLTPFVHPATGEITNAATAARGMAGRSPQMQIAENKAAEAGAKMEADYRTDAQMQAAYADSIRSLRMSDPGTSYSGGASDFRLGLDNLFAVIPGLREFVDKNKLGTAQAFEAQYKTIILNLVSPMLKGQTSDRDVRIMLSSGPGLFMTPEGRQVFYDLIENRAERAERIAEAASTHMEQYGNMRGFKANRAGGEIKGVISTAGRNLGSGEQLELRKIIDAAAAGDAQAREAMRKAVQAGWVLY